MAAWIVAVMVAAAVAGVGAPAAAQTPVQAPARPTVQAETDLVQGAALRESAGDLDGAERLLREALELRPSSAPALLALDRVLRIQGRPGDFPALAEAALESDPGSTLLNQLLLRSYSELDREDALERAAERWVAVVPRLEVPYRELARVWSSRGEYGRARAVLERGRQAVGDPVALALELGDVYAAVGEPRLAVREWHRTVDASGGGLGQLRRRLRALPDGGAGVTEELVDLLAADWSAAGRVDAALELAVEAGLESRARSMAEQRLATLDVGDQRRLLDRIARGADAGGHTVLAHWAYDRLLALGDTREPDTRRAVLRERLNELARELGDTVAAADGGAVESTSGSGPLQRRMAAATRIEVLAEQDPELAARSLARFRAEHPDSPETDGLVAVVGVALLARGQEEDAEALLIGADGPRSDVLRGRLLLLRGDVERARRAFMAAANSLRGVEATDALGMVELLGQISAGAATLVGDALTERDRGQPGGGVDRVEAGLDALEPGDRPPLLDFVAQLAADAGLGAEARELRRRLVTDHPRSREAPGALLALARDMAGEPAGEPAARELLERLIIEHPRSALVPQARRALDRLDGGRRE